MGTAADWEVAERAAEARAVAATVAAAREVVAREVVARAEGDELGLGADEVDLEIIELILAQAFDPELTEEGAAAADVAAESEPPDAETPADIAALRAELAT